VTNRALYDLGGDIVGRSAHGSLFFFAKLQFGCEAEVSHLEVHICAEKNISQFEITVDDSIAVHVIYCRDQLKHKESGLFSCQSFSFFNHFAKGLHYLLFTLLTQSSRMM
jgi:hypothetical protein